MTLWHYTCTHGRRGIGKYGLVLPPRTWNPRAMVNLPPGDWRGETTWFTTRDRPDAHALGLTSLLTRCDRTAFRYRVTDEAGIVPWLDSPLRAALGPAELEALEGGGDREPACWWVATAAVKVRLDP